MPLSFPRKRESTPQTFADALPADRLPAFAGMTVLAKGWRGLAGGIAVLLVAHTVEEENGEEKVRIISA
jgi:hypothetical protein